MKASILHHFFFQVVLLFDALGWDVKMPKEIHGLRGSCLVIPCSFNYTSDPPKDPRRVVWYKWSMSSYPLVYDALHPDNVFVTFRGRTDLYGNSSMDCSLLIKNLEQSHNRDKLYTWIDPENVKKSTYRFYDVTSTILVDENPQPPNITVQGGERMGERITVTCSMSHTCPYSKPNITLYGIEGSDHIEHELIKDGLWKINLTRTGVVKTENLTIECLVTHHGGLKVTFKEVKHAKCVHNVSIEPELADVTEGVAQVFTCSVHHSCQRETPNITWNYENMEVPEGNTTLSGFNQVVYSNITFLGASEDHGKKLICTVEVSGENVTTFVFLNVQYLTLFGLNTIGLYILTPSLVFLLAGLFCGLIIYKKRQRSKDTRTLTGNQPLSRSLPRSDPKSFSDYDCTAEYSNMKEISKESA